MVLKTWAALASNECVAHSEVVNAVANGLLRWVTTNPGLAAGLCYTRTDFETYITHSSMTGSGIALTELMSKQQMEAYRTLASTVTVSIGAQESEWLAEPTLWRGRCWFTPGSGCLSVLIEVNINGAGFAFNEQRNTPSPLTQLTNWVNMTVPQSLEFRITPYSAAGLGGSPGPAATSTIFPP